MTTQMTAAKENKLPFTCCLFTTSVSIETATSPNSAISSRILSNLVNGIKRFCENLRSGSVYSIAAMKCFWLVHSCDVRRIHHILAGKHHCMHLVRFLLKCRTQLLPVPDSRLVGTPSRFFLRSPPLSQSLAQATNSVVSSDPAVLCIKIGKETLQHHN